MTIAVDLGRKETKQTNKQTVLDIAFLTAYNVDSDETQWIVASHLILHCWQPHHPLYMTFSVNGLRYKRKIKKAKQHCALQICVIHFLLHQAINMHLKSLLLYEMFSSRTDFGTQTYSVDPDQTAPRGNV